MAGWKGTNDRLGGVTWPRCIEQILRLALNMKSAICITAGLNRHLARQISPAKGIHAAGQSRAPCHVMNYRAFITEV